MLFVLEETLGPFLGRRAEIMLEEGWAKHDAASSAQWCISSSAALTESGLPYHSLHLWSGQFYNGVVLHRAAEGSR